MATAAALALVDAATLVAAARLRRGLDLGLAGNADDAAQGHKAD